MIATRTYILAAEPILAAITLVVLETVRLAGLSLGKERFDLPFMRVVVNFVQNREHLQKSAFSYQCETHQLTF